jgi:hypothetical protein
MKKGTSKYASIGKAKIDFGNFYIIQWKGGSLWIVSKTGEMMNITNRTRDKLSEAIWKVFEEYF